MAVVMGDLVMLTLTCSGGGCGVLFHANPNPSGGGGGGLVMLTLALQAVVAGGLVVRLPRALKEPPRTETESVTMVRPWFGV